MNIRLQYENNFLREKLNSSENKNFTELIDIKEISQ